MRLPDRVTCLYRSNVAGDRRDETLPNYVLDPVSQFLRAQGEEAEAQFLIHRALVRRGEPGITPFLLDAAANAFRGWLPLLSLGDPWCARWGEKPFEFTPEQPGLGRAWTEADWRAAEASALTELAPVVENNPYAMLPFFLERAKRSHVNLPIPQLAPNPDHFERNHFVAASRFLKKRGVNVLFVQSPRGLENSSELRGSISRQLAEDGMPLAEHSAIIFGAALSAK